MLLHRVKNFITEEERDILINYYRAIINHKSYSIIHDNVCDDPDPEWYVTNKHHSLVNKISDRISEYFNTTSCANGENEHQIMVNILPSGAKVKPHIDRLNSAPVEGHDPLVKINDGISITKFILFINKPSSEFRCDYKEIQTEDTELIIFEPSDVIHEVTENLSSDYVIMIIFARITNESDKWLDRKLHEIRNHNGYSL